MRKLLLCGAMALVLAGVSQGRDCDGLSAALEAIEEQAAIQMTTMIYVGMSLEGIDRATVERIAAHLESPTRLLLSGRDGGRITEATAAIVRAKDAATAAAGCAEGMATAPGSPQPGQVPCEVDGQRRPSIGMTLERAKECFGEFTLRSQYSAGGSVIEEWETKNGRGLLTVEDGRIIDWSTY